MSKNGEPESDELKRMRLEHQATALLAEHGFRRDGRPITEDPSHIVDAMNFASDTPTAKDAVHAQHVVTTIAPSM